jgi:EAL domain-containing protein (putative c-di-GMP-specific phosphodiesterase class I)
MVVTASLGIAIGEGGESPESLLRDADTAMYRAKERGRARSELFDDALRSKSARRLATSSAIRYALDRREFAVHYQPVVDLVTGGLAGVEALLRWQQPGRGLVYPGDFVPIAEESGLIVPIGAWLLEQACNDAVEWRRIRAAAPPSRGRGQGDAVSMAVNLSVHQVLAPDIVELVAGVLRRTGLPPGDLCLEVTESVFIEDVEHFERTLAGLKDLGLSLAIDDFGTGYSSLSYLRRFPVDAVKVDQSFVGGLGSNSNDTALVTAVVAMARALGLDVVAEGVETRRQLAELKRLEVPRAQGYLLGRAMPAAAIAQLVRASHRWRVD